jgi:hypothetical protein
MHKCEEVSHLQQLLAGFDFHSAKGTLIASAPGEAQGGQLALRAALAAEERDATSGRPSICFLTPRIGSLSTEFVASLITAAAARRHRRPRARSERAAASLRRLRRLLRSLHRTTTFSRSSGPLLRACVIHTTAGTRE